MIIYDNYYEAMCEAVIYDEQVIPVPGGFAVQPYKLVASVVVDDDLDFLAF